MTAALSDAALKPDQITYINLHGTGTQLNDPMEARAVTGIFGGDVPCSSTKGMTGHTLGAAGACEAAFLWLTLHPSFNAGRLPLHVWDGVADPEIPSLNFVTSQPAGRIGIGPMLSNSFAFGGSNVSVILGTE